MIIVGIFGPSGSGKTTLANKILKHFTENTAITAGIVSQDSFYREYLHLTNEEITATINFDDPATIDFDLLRKGLQDAKQGKPFVIPSYDYQTNLRSTVKQEIFFPKQLIILDGHLIMSDPELRKLLDFVVYVDVDPDIALMQRIQREVELRGKVSDYTLSNYKTKIAPMLRQHILPYKNNANVLYKNDESHAEFFKLLKHITLKFAIVNSRHFKLFSSIRENKEVITPGYGKLTSGK